jgi:hypothetical protein
MQDAAYALTKQFLAWVSEAPRSYADAEAWRRSCPHLSVWEDAIANGLIQFKNGSAMKDAQFCHPCGHLFKMIDLSDAVEIKTP